MGTTTIGDRPSVHDFETRVPGGCSKPIDAAAAFCFNQYYRAAGVGHLAFMRLLDSGGEWRRVVNFE
jgi:hypothetical protein